MRLKVSRCEDKIAENRHYQQYRVQANSNGHGILSNGSNQILYIIILSLSGAPIYLQTSMYKIQRTSGTQEKKF